ncbi:MAG: MFS transporter [Chthonomonas sp.]|nr:MFS transporter [Chthonomonas sp.]
MHLSARAVADRLRENSLRAFQHRDFRLLWIGAFVSFFGSWIQNVAQGFLVYELTRDVRALAMVSFLASAPSAVLGPILGAMTDLVNRRVVLIICQAVYGINALFIALMITTGNIHYHMILAVALINGIVTCVEVPTRQSLVGSIVAAEDISAAVPINAMTFNLARLLGPSVGGFLAATFGAQACYAVNGFSYLALIASVFMIRANISARTTRSEPIKDLVLEGMRFTWRDRSLRAVFICEAIVSGCGLFYISQMAAITREMFGLDQRGLGLSMSAIGVGTMTSLIVTMGLSHKPIKTLLVRLSMVSCGVSLLVLSLLSHPAAAFITFACIGASVVMLFNTCNTLFQLLSPERLRGRTLSMHVWALNGFGTITTPIFGLIAHSHGLRTALQVGAACVLIGGICAWTAKLNFDAEIAKRTASAN